MAEPTTYYYRDGNLIQGTTWDGKPAKGDIAFRTSLFAMFRNDIALLMGAKWLLNSRRRWPVRMDEPDGNEHRNPNRMTQDPYITFYSACMELGHRHWIKEVKPPGYLCKPVFRSWRRYLITGKPKHLARYEFWVLASSLFEKNKPMFAIWNSGLMAWIAKSEKAMAIIRPKVEPENLCLRQLVKHPDRYQDIHATKDFVPYENFLWQLSTTRKEWKLKPLPMDQEYYLDWDSLLYFWARNNGAK